MNKWIKISIVALAAVSTTTGYAQDGADKKAKSSKQTKEIIIKKSGDKSEKMTIVVDGDNVTINGKPAGEFKGDDIRVLQHRGELDALRAHGFTAPRGGLQALSNINGFEMKANKAFLGVMTSKADGGARITEVTEESAAAKAGLKEDDVITKVGDKKIISPADLTSAVGSYKPNDKVAITFKRDGKEMNATAILSENRNAPFAFNFRDGDFNINVPKPPTPPSLDGLNFNWYSKPKMGLQIQDLEEGKGVKVKEVDEDSPAFKAGIKVDDVITQVDGKAVSGVDELRNEIKNLKEGDSVKFSYRRGNKSETTEVKLPKKIKTVDL